jgi:hypothetical protein
MKYKLPLIGAVIASSLILSGCDQRKIEIDYKALAAAIGEELSRRPTPSADTSATSNDLSSKPVTKEEVDYIIDDRFYQRNVPLGKSIRLGFNYPICFAVNRRGGMLMYKDPFENHGCTDALADWLNKNPSVSSGLKDNVFNDMGYQYDDKGLPVPKLKRN